jgi:hypothetical protein
MVACRVQLHNGIVLADVTSSTANQSFPRPADRPQRHLHSTPLPKAGPGRRLVASVTTGFTKDHKETDHVPAPLPHGGNEKAAATPPLRYPLNNGGCFRPASLTQSWSSCFLLFWCRPFPHIITCARVSFTVVTASGKVGDISQGRMGDGSAAVAKDARRDGPVSRPDQQRAFTASVSPERDGSRRRSQIVFE